MAGVQGKSGGARTGAGRPKKAIDRRTARTFYPTGVTGPHSLFRGKQRMPISVKLTQQHLDACARNAARLGVTRSDLIALLVERYADTVAR
jgi:hypothetical protein